MEHWPNCISLIPDSAQSCLTWTEVSTWKKLDLRFGVPRLNDHPPKNKQIRCHGHRTYSNDQSPNLWDIRIFVRFIHFLFNSEFLIWIFQFSQSATTTLSTTSSVPWWLFGPRSGPFHGICQRYAISSCNIIHNESHYQTVTRFG